MVWKVYDNKTCTEYFFFISLHNLLLYLCTSPSDAPTSNRFHSVSLVGLCQKINHEFKHLRELQMYLWRFFFASAFCLKVTRPSLLAGEHILNHLSMLSRTYLNFLWDFCYFKDGVLKQNVLRSEAGRTCFSFSSKCAECNKLYTSTLWLARRKNSSIQWRDESWTSLVVL